jgi:hypothetical protein
VRDQELMLAGLRRLLAEPGAKLFGGGRSRGVFPQRTVAAERAAASLLEQGYLEADDDQGICRITPLGLKWLAENDEVKTLLEDVLRSAETQRERLESIAESCLKEATRLAQQRMAVSTILSRMGSAAADGDAIDEAVLDCLSRRHHGAMADSSVAEVFHDLLERGVDLSIGRFHDSLRRLRESGRVRLAPWTGPLYEMPSPALALLIGHEVLYYVRPQQASRAA